MPISQVLWERLCQHQQLADLPQEKPTDVESCHSPTARHHRKMVAMYLSSMLALCTIFLLLFSFIFPLKNTPRFNKNAYDPFRYDATLRTRHEWRSLTVEKRFQYISAVQCLRHKPSRLGLNQSLYDDFPWVHSHAAKDVHETASFLAWHRYFIATYESALRSDCGYEDRLPYWDWTLDWESITEAPVWNNVSGFGGNGVRAASNYTLFHGHCVVDGPFANLQVLYTRNKFSQHCLTRGFLESNSTAMEQLSQGLQPKAIQDILSNRDYASFNLDLEEKSHNSIPRIVRGDFSVFTAPYDPVFYLHHAQLDRIWFIWQQQVGGREREYTGFVSPNRSIHASPDDFLSMSGLAPKIRVSEVLDTSNGKLNYVYPM